MDPETKDEPRTTDVPITGRKLAVRLPSEWLDRLLVAVCEVEPGQPPEDALGAVLGAASAALPHASFGVRVPFPSSILAIRRSPHLIAAEPPLEGPLFPELAFESQFAVDIGGPDRPSAPAAPGQLDLEPSGLLSIAANDPDVLPESPALAALASRLSLALGSALRIARQAPRASRSIPPVSREIRSRAVNHDKLAGIGRVVAGVVHELNNPVTSILAYSEYLRRKAEHAPLEHADLERLARIEEAAQRIHAFSRSLIAYARPTAEVPAPLLIHDVLDRALVFCEHVLTRVTVERAFGEVKPVRGVGDQLAQVFVNLFTNAANAMSEVGGTLRIQTSLAESGRTVHITVIDTGRGIAEHALPRIFEPFFTTTESDGGTGLGLSIVRDIIESHDGRVWAERRAGMGAVFHVTLPAVPDDD